MKSYFLAQLTGCVLLFAQGALCFRAFELHQGFAAYMLILSGLIVAFSMALVAWRREKLLHMQHDILMLTATKLHKVSR